MIVCQCRRISDRRLRREIHKGHRSLGDLCRQTNAGNDCGSCVRAIKELLEHEIGSPDHSRQEDGAEHATA